MTLEQLFSLCGNLSMVGWLGLVIAPRWRVTRDWAAPVIAPIIIGTVYVWLMTSNYPAAPEGAGSFGSAALHGAARAGNQLQNWHAENFGAARKS